MVPHVLGRRGPAAGLGPYSCPSFSPERASRGLPDFCTEASRTSEESSPLWVGPSGLEVRTKDSLTLAERWGPPSQNKRAQTGLRPQDGLKAVRKVQDF